MNTPHTAPLKTTAPLQNDMLDDALDFVREHAKTLHLPSGEPAIDHALGMLSIIQTLHVDSATLAAAVLCDIAQPCDLSRDQLQTRFGADVEHLISDVCKLMELGLKGEKAANAIASNANRAQRDGKTLRHIQVESLRKMLLAFAQDIRVVLIRLASRLQTLRYYAAAKITPPQDFARETLDLDAPLANRLGIWQIKWELEDLAFRFEDPDTYKQIARHLDEKRAERELFIASAVERLKEELLTAGIHAQVNGRPKHIYSIWKKMHGKQLSFAQLHDVRAFRIIVQDVKECYGALGIVHHIWRPIPKEFDDYISRPKPNGYKSLHTVVLDEQDRTLEIQIRTVDMHRFSEYGVAAHWRYKEAGTKGYRGESTATGSHDEKIAWLRQLLTWQPHQATGDTLDNTPSASILMAMQEAPSWPPAHPSSAEEPIYVLTPQARIIELPHGATPVDFAYHLHTELGHRCRGARIDGAMAPLNTPLQNGQTVEIITAKQGGPSRDWLNMQHGYLCSGRAKQKVRAWFHAIEHQETCAAGRATLEKFLQREGKTSINFEELSGKLAFKSPDDLFHAVGKDIISLRQIEHTLNEAQSEEPAAKTSHEELLEPLTRESSRSSVTRGASGGVLILGQHSLVTQFARCCRPAPPDLISGFITRGKGASIHRAQCSNFLRLAKHIPERVVQASWADNALRTSSTTLYPVDLYIQAKDRPGLLHNIFEVFSRERINITNASSNAKSMLSTIQLTIEIPHAARLQNALKTLASIPDILQVTRKN